MAAFLSFLQFWGPPSWTSSFPQGTVFRFLDSLWFDVLALALYCAPGFLRAKAKRSTYSPFVAGAGFVAAFCALVALSRPLEDLDSLLRLFAFLTLGALFAMAALRIRSLLTERTRVPASEAFRLGWAIATPALWLLFFAIGFFAPRLWPFFHLLGGVILLAPLATLMPLDPPARPANAAGEASAAGDVGAQGKFGISAREAEVLALVGEGLTNQEIADKLFISLTTVKSHLAHLFEKTGTRNRVELLRIVLSEDRKNP